MAMMSVDLAGGCNDFRVRANFNEPWRAGVELFERRGKPLRMARFFGDVPTQRLFGFLGRDRPTRPGSQGGFPRFPVFPRTPFLVAQ